MNISSATYKHHPRPEDVSINTMTSVFDKTDLIPSYDSGMKLSFPDGKDSCEFQTTPGVL